MERTFATRMDFEGFQTRYFGPSERDDAVHDDPGTFLPSPNHQLPPQKQGDVHKDWGHYQIDHIGSIAADGPGGACVVVC